MLSRRGRPSVILLYDIILYIINDNIYNNIMYYSVPAAADYNNNNNNMSADILLYSSRGQTATHTRSVTYSSRCVCRFSGEETVR